MEIKRGEIYWSDLNPARGSEISKVRPVLIVSNNISNKYSSTITILPITSNTEKIYPYEVQGVLTKTRMKEIDEAILIHLDIDL